jgi:hypothetical protein
LLYLNELELFLLGRRLMKLGEDADAARTAGNRAEPGGAGDGQQSG